jgi:hypothetical protein
MSMGFFPVLPGTTRMPDDGKDLEEAKLVEPDVDEPATRADDGEPVGRSDLDADHERTRPNHQADDDEG